MADDDLETEYHLTHSGWQQGTVFFFRHTKQLISPPVDRVLTLVHRLYQRSGWSPEEISVREIWRSPEVTDDDLLNLRKRFPFPRGET